MAYDLDTPLATLLLDPVSHADGALILLVHRSPYMSKMTLRQYSSDDAARTVLHDLPGLGRTKKKQIADIFQEAYWDGRIEREPAVVAPTDFERLAVLFPKCDIAGLEDPDALARFRQELISICSEDIYQAPRLVDVLARRFGVGLPVLSYVEIGKIHGISGTRTASIFVEGMRVLRHPMRSRFLRVLLERHEEAILDWVGDHDMTSDKDWDGLPALAILLLSVRYWDDRSRWLPELRDRSVRS